MAELNPELVAFSQNNKTFWDRQKVLMDLRMADRAILETAIEAIAFEAKRGISVARQMSFEKALEDAENAKRRFIQQQARSGGKAPKADPLRRIIIEVVRQDPEISLKQLLSELRLRAGDGIIEEVDETSICFKYPGTMVLRQGETIEKKAISKSVAISDLKHRLTRARKKILKEGWSR